MSRDRAVKLVVLTMLCMAVFVGQALAVLVRVTLSGNQTVTASGNLTRNGVDQAGGAFNLTAPGGAAVSVVLNVPDTSNDIHFNWTRPAVPDAGSCSKAAGVLPALPTSVSFPDCASPADLAERVTIEVVKPTPSLTTYGLIILALLLAGTAVWMFRRRRVSVA